MRRGRGCPGRALRIALAVLLLIEVFFLVKLFGEGGTETTLILSSIGIFVLCVLTWRGSASSRWLLVAFLAWRVAEIVIDMRRNFVPGDHRIAGTLILLAIYLAAGAVVASPLGASN